MNEITLKYMCVLVMHIYFFVVKDFIVDLVSFFLIENHGFLTYDRIIKLVLPYL